MYFDNNATTFLTDFVKREMKKVIDAPLGNPSSAHTGGDFSRQIISDAQDVLNNFFSVSGKHFIFTGSGSEANNCILKLTEYNGLKPFSIITTEIEHSSILKTCDYLSWKGIQIQKVDLGKNGLIDLNHLEMILKSNQHSLISIGWANNETGIIQPMKSISELANKYHALLHTDAAQIVGREEINLNNYNIDFMTFTGHKLHAPKGIGIIYARDESLLKPVIHGGEQQNGKHAGTENLLGIAGVKAAFSERKDNFEKENGKKKEKDTKK